MEFYSAAVINPLWLIIGIAVAGIGFRVVANATEGILGRRSLLLGLAAIAVLGFVIWEATGFAPALGVTFAFIAIESWHLGNYILLPSGKAEAAFTDGSEVFESRNGDVLTGNGNCETDVKCNLSSCPACSSKDTRK